MDKFGLERCGDALGSRDKSTKDDWVETVGDQLLDFRPQLLEFFIFSRVLREANGLFEKGLELWILD